MLHFYLRVLIESVGHVCPGLLDLGFLCWVDVLSCYEQTHVSEQGIASLDIPFWICLLIELLQRSIIIIFSKDNQDRDVELMSVLSSTENSCVATRKS